ncbi:uncharacterized protein LOC110990567 isoform X2 [Acanthaster planci]|uniref:Uncharacterized protein LOC110990567 isoform X2 n=1 Tax=Acanthaster planci TaxID=133434 RepID=A0A8B8A0N0_ACAPL|nr:uncharacterized protein LOC110990567 isoform X2 [Acanthaster planci]
MEFHSTKHGPGTRKLVHAVIIVTGILTLVCSALSGCSLHHVHVCRSASGNTTQDAFGLANESASVQLGLVHKLPCLSRRPEESPSSLLSVVWYRGNSIADPAKEILISYQDNHIYPESDRCEFSPDFGLVIKGIEEKDNATFLCEVILKTYEERVKEIRVQVLDNSFPPRIGDRSRPANLQRGHRHKVPCRAPQTPEAPADVVYWSVGEGITTDTEIIAARFFKHGGTNLFFNYGADFSIDSDASLTVNSLESFQENWVTFWCHIFQSNGTLSSSSTEVYISEDQKSSTAFRNSTTSTFYLKRGSKQVLPCTSWTRGNAVCNVQWFHELSEQPVVSYNVSANILEVDSVYDFAGSFGLVISSANSSHAGPYNCTVASTDSGTKIGVINVFVECPNPGMPEGGTRRGPSSFMPGAEVSFHCLDGYEREGSTFSVCQENGEWSLPVPKCIPNCLEIAAPGNGSLTHSTAEWRRNGSRIDFSCDPGFSLVGAASVTCENGQWDHPVPTCFGVFCKTITDQSHCFDVKWLFSRELAI